MEKKHERSLLSTLFLIIVIGVSSCATSGSNLVKTGEVRVGYHPSIRSTGLTFRCGQNTAVPS